MAAWGYEFIVSCGILSTLEDKICIPTQLFNILYIMKSSA